MWRAFALVLLILPGLPARAETPASVARLFHQQGNFDGVVVVAKHGKVTYAEGFGSANRAKGYPNTRDTPYRICSLTRQFTALLVMQQVQQGWLRLDGTLRTYLPGLFPASSGGITVRNLLTYTPCLANLDDVPSFYELTAPRFSTPDFVIKAYLQAPPKTVPGERFAALG